MASASEPLILDSLCPRDWRQLARAAVLLGVVLDKLSPPAQ